MLNLANAQDGAGNYLFSGFRSKTKPFERDSVSLPPTVTYNGDANVQLVEVGPGLSLPANFVVSAEIKAAYDALEDLASRLTAGDASGISGVSLELIEQSSRDVRKLLGEAGGRIQEFAAAADTAVRRSDEFTRQISDREDADMAKVVVDLQSAETAYQSALAAFSSMTGMSLLDFLR
jgi:flagellar hook-associated protein 3 FlgL